MTLRSAAAASSPRRKSRSFVIQWYQRMAEEPIYDWVFFALLLVGEAVLGYAIICRVGYTEIDWKAYMQEVAAWYDEGELDYRKIRGDTGPLVYPAGFLYLFAWLRNVTDQGRDIRSAQYIFLAFYLANQCAVWLIYHVQIRHIRRAVMKTKGSLAVSHRIWSWRIAMGCTCLSKRVHSIFLLRLFNDGPTMLLLYLSILCFMNCRWNVGCVIFSLAVSIKMNVLLFAPGLLLLLLQASPNLETVVLVRLLGCCALPQLILGAPFLLSHPVSYLRKAFELDRVFFYKWTVNWKFLPKDVFLSKPLSVLLLVLHLGVLALLAVRWLAAAQQQTGKRIFWKRKTLLSPHYIVYTLLVSNYVGIVFARSLHYQFYSWYFHALPYLLWSSSSSSSSAYAYPVWMRLALLLGIEMAYLTFPATAWSSAVLQVCHLVILLQIRPPSALLVGSTTADDSSTTGNVRKDKLA